MLYGKALRLSLAVQHSTVHVYTLMHLYAKEERERSKVFFFCI